MAEGTGVWKKGSEVWRPRTEAAPDGGIATEALKPCLGRLSRRRWKTNKPPWMLRLDRDVFSRFFDLVRTAIDN